MIDVFPFEARDGAGDLVNVIGQYWNPQKMCLYFSVVTLTGRIRCVPYDSISDVTAALIPMEE